MTPRVEKGFHDFHTQPNNRLAYISIIGKSLVPPELLPETQITDQVLGLIDEHAAATNRVHTGRPTSGAPNTGTPTVSPGSPSAAPATAEPSTQIPRFWKSKTRSFNRFRSSKLHTSQMDTTRVIAPDDRCQLADAASHAIGIIRQ